MSKILKNTALSALGAGVAAAASVAGIAIAKNKEPLSKIELIGVGAAAALGATYIGVTRFLKERKVAKSYEQQVNNIAESIQ